jgi:hypothetical protein
MTAWWVILTAGTAGCVGGFANAVLSGQLELPKRDAKAGVYRPGWIGDVVVGGIAALVFWGLYGPYSGAVLLGPGDPDGPAVILRVSELFGALLTGVGGGRLLTAEVEKRILTRETEELDRTKDTLVQTLKELAEE